MSRLFVGIDCGLTGAIGLVHGDGSFHSCEDMPTAARGSGRVKREVDAAGLLHLLRPHAGSIAFGLVEKVGARPGQGVASMFSLGHSTGVIDGVLAALWIPHAAISPTKWKSQEGLPAVKGLVLAAARRRWHDAPLIRAKDHGRAEALFLALLAARHTLGGFDPGPPRGDRRPDGPTQPAGEPDVPAGDSVCVIQQ